MSIDEKTSIYAANLFSFLCPLVNNSDRLFCVNLVKLKQIIQEALLYIVPIKNWPKQEFAQDLEGRSETVANIL